MSQGTEKSTFSAQKEAEERFKQAVHELSKAGQQEFALRQELYLLQRSRTEAPVRCVKIRTEATGILKKIAEHVASALREMPMMNASQQLFFLVQQEGIDFYKNTLLSKKLHEIIANPLVVLRVFTMFLQKIFDELSEKDQTAIKNGIITAAQGYKASLDNLYLRIDAVLQSVPWDFSVSDEMLEQFVKKMLMPFQEQTEKSGSLYLSIGQSLSYQTIITQITSPKLAKQFFLLPFSKGSAKNFDVLNSKAALSQDEVFQYLYLDKVERAIFSNVTDLERFTFDQLMSAIDIKNQPLVICDQVESLGSLKALHSFLTHDDQNPLNDVRYLWQVQYHADSAKAAYTKEEWYKKIKDKITIFSTTDEAPDDSIALQEDKRNRIKIAGITTAEKKEQYRIVPTMAPECWLFAIPLIANEGFMPSEQALGLLKSMLEFMEPSPQEQN